MWAPPPPVCNGSIAAPDFGRHITLRGTPIYLFLKQNFQQGAPDLIYIVNLSLLALQPVINVSLRRQSRRNKGRYSFISLQCLCYVTLFTYLQSLSP